MDIVLGTFRCCVNNPSNVNAARVMMSSVLKLMWHEKIGDAHNVLEHGLIVKPTQRRLKLILIICFIT